MQRRTLTAAEKFDKFAVKGDADECWGWAGYISDQGYALIRFCTYNVRAHRFAYETYVGPIPEGLVIDHICRNRSCVNPHHLRPMDRVQNMLIGIRSNQNRDKTHCKYGHEFTTENTGQAGPGKRYCKRCAYLRCKARWERLHPKFADE